MLLFSVLHVDIEKWWEELRYKTTTYTYSSQHCRWVRRKKYRVKGGKQHLQSHSGYYVEYDNTQSSRDSTSTAVTFTELEEMEGPEHTIISQSLK